MFNAITSQPTFLASFSAGTQKYFWIKGQFVLLYATQ